MGRHEDLTGMSRRELLRLAVIAGVGGAGTGLAGGFLSPGPAAAQSPLTPETALRQLTDGNQRFASGAMRSYRENGDILRQKTAENQQPFAAVVLGTKVIMVLGHGPKSRRDFSRTPRRPWRD